MQGGARKGAGRPKGSTGKTFISPEQIERHRARIQTNKIIERLNAIASGDIPSDNATSPSITAGLGLLKKVIPDMAAVQHTGPDGGAIQVIIID